MTWEDYERLIKVFEETDYFSIIGFGTGQNNGSPDLYAKIVDKRTCQNDYRGQTHEHRSYHSRW